MATTEHNNLQELNESQRIKIALYQELFATKHIVIPEVAAGKCVADMLVLNSAIHIIEIKSDKDKLVRLANQIKVYQKFANYVSIAVQEKFLEQVTADKNLNGVGIYHVTSNHKISQIRRPKYQTILKKRYLQYWCVEEINGTLAGFHGVYKMKTEEKRELLMKLLTHEELAKATLFRLREKYLGEYLKRIKALHREDFKDVLKSRFGKASPLKITPLTQIPCGVFIDFKGRR